jgi:hypothetical protein
MTSIASRITKITSGIVRNKAGCDLNSIFLFINILICTCGVCIYGYKGSNQYIDGLTIILLCIFGELNLLMLLYEKKKRDPFILIVIIVSSVFYMGRVVTLLYDPWSVPLDAGSYTCDDLNYSLIFIILSNASIFLGLCMAGGRIFYKKEVSREYTANPFKVIIIFIFTIGIIYSIQLASGFIGRLAGYISNIFNILIILLCSILYLILNYKNLSKITRSMFLVLFIGFVILQTLSGSRSALLSMAFLLLVGFLSVKSRIRISKRSILIIIVLACLSIILFPLATHIRAVLGTVQSPFSSIEMSLLKETDIDGLQGITDLYRPIFDRIGFLDYSSVVIINHEIYSKIISFTYYCKSIIDNVLTPGFTVFEVPRVSHAMSYIARGESIPTVEDIMAAYQSDMPTIYGEYYVLFLGFPALIILFVLSFIFKKVYLSIRSKDTFSFYLYRALILYIFYIWLNSFGMDWLIFDISCIIITVGLFRRFYKMRKEGGGRLKKVYCVSSKVIK